MEFFYVFAPGTPGAKKAIRAYREYAAVPPAERAKYMRKRRKRVRLYVVLACFFVVPLTLSIIQGSWGGTLVCVVWLAMLGAFIMRARRHNRKLKDPEATLKEFIQQGSIIAVPQFVHERIRTVARKMARQHPGLRDWTEYREREYRVYTSVMSEVSHRLMLLVNECPNDPDTCLCENHLTEANRLLIRQEAEQAVDEAFEALTVTYQMQLEDARRRRTLFNETIGGPELPELPEALPESQDPDEGPANKLKKKKK